MAICLRSAFNLKHIQSRTLFTHLPHHGRMLYPGANYRHYTVALNAQDGQIGANKPPKYNFTTPARHEATWTSTSEALTTYVEPITGAILPWANLNWFQCLVFPYTYATMYYMDFLLNYMPWWAAILGTTVTMRLALFPLHVRNQIVGIKTHNILPQTQKLQAKINEALSDGNSYEVSFNRTKLMLLFKENGISIKQRLMPSLLQAPAYASMFFLLRKLGEVPVETMLTGGALWFTNLTVPDPYYVLPVLTSASMAALIEFTMPVTPQGMSPMMRYMMRSLPVGLFFLMQSFPAAVTLFWSSSNLITLLYAVILKQKWATRAFKIPDRIEHDPSQLPLSQQSFKGQMKEAMDKSRRKRDAETLRRLDDEAFRKAAIGPLPKTYKEPPKYNQEKSKGS